MASMSSWKLIHNITMPYYNANRIFAKINEYGGAPSKEYSLTI